MLVCISYVLICACLCSFLAHEFYYKERLSAGGMAARRLITTTARVLLAESCASRRYGSYAGGSAWVAPSAATAWAVGTGGAAGLLRPPLGLLPNGARGAKTEASKVRLSLSLSLKTPTPCAYARTTLGLFVLTCGSTACPLAAEERTVREVERSYVRGALRAGRAPQPTVALLGFGSIAVGNVPGAGVQLHAGPG
jgi:hypothetical protein